MRPEGCSHTQAFSKPESDFQTPPPRETTLPERCWPAKEATPTIRGDRLRSRGTATEPEVSKKYQSLTGETNFKGKFYACAPCALNKQHSVWMCLCVDHCSWDSLPFPSASYTFGPGPG